MAKWRDIDMLCQVRGLDVVQKDKIFAIGYCFGGGGVLELARAWPNTPGLLGQYTIDSLCIDADCRANPEGVTVLYLARVGVGGFHAGPLVTAGPKAQPGRPQRHLCWRALFPPPFSMLHQCLLNQNSQGPLLGLSAGCSSCRQHPACQCVQWS